MVRRSDGRRATGSAGRRWPIGPAPVRSGATGRPARRRRPARASSRPRVLELEELLSSHLNTRVKVDMSGQAGRVVVEFATLEDLERIYKLMVGGVETPPSARLT